MKLSHPYLHKDIEFTHGKINVLTVENQFVYRSMIHDLINQSAGYHGKFTLSQNLEPINLSNEIEFVSDIFHIDNENQKITSHMQSTLVSYALDNFSEDIQYISDVLNRFHIKLISNYPFQLRFENNIKISDIIQLFNIKLEYGMLSFYEKFLQFMNLHQNCLKKQIFIWLNLKSALTFDELFAFYESVACENYYILLIENKFHKSIAEYEVNYKIKPNLWTPFVPLYDS